MQRPPLPSARALPAALVAFALLGVGGSARAQGDEDGPPILPGYWAYTTTALIFPVKSEKRCIGRHDIDKVMSGAINHHYTCVYPNRTLAEGRLKMTGVCTDKKGGHVSVAMDGAFTPTRFSITANMGGLPVGMKGHRLSAVCPSEQAQ